MNVSPESRADRVAGADDAAHPLADLAQQPVAGGVAQAVVDLPEGVEVDGDDDEPLTLAARRSDGLGDAVAEQQLVRQPGGGVVDGPVAQLLGHPGVLEGRRADGRHGGEELLGVIGGGILGHDQPPLLGHVERHPELADRRRGRPQLGLGGQQRAGGPIRASSTSAGSIDAWAASAVRNRVSARSRSRSALKCSASTKTMPERAGTMNRPATGTTVAAMPAL